MKQLAGLIALVVVSIVVIRIGLASIINHGSPQPEPQDWTFIQPLPSQPSQPPVIMEVLDPSLEQYAPMWRDEIGRRFSNAVGVLVHGGDFEDNRWIVGSHRQPWKHVTEITTVVREIQAKYPGRTIVVLACNTGHLHLGVPGVYYATSSVWCVPDRAITPEMFASGLATEKLRDPDEDPDPVYVPVVVRPEPSRWQQDPEVVGNIWEFITD
jgi:hypothetical protein